jgi:ABC-type multidrug transport system ATPase subunit
LLLSFCGLFYVFAVTDSVVAILFAGEIALSIVFMFLSIVMQRRTTPGSVPPFVTRWTAGDGDGADDDGSFAAAVPQQAPLVSSRQDVVPIPMSFDGSDARTGQVKGVSFQLSEVDFSLHNGTKLLSNVSLNINRSRSVAVMGPSGSGKSTLLAVLSGRASYGFVQGTLRVSGREASDLSFLRHVTGFVPQDDVLHGELTVIENIYYQASLRLPNTKTSEEIATCIKETVNNLNLERIKDSRVGTAEKRGVSGGQRKRVSIAMELVSQPLLLFADEPTSGLDSTTSHEVVKSLNETAGIIGTTVIAVIHQPRYETLCLFDDLILLGAGGHLVYAGSTVDSVEYFERQLQVEFPAKANPADIFLDAIQPSERSTPEDHAETWRNLKGSSHLESEIQSKKEFKRSRPAMLQATLIFMERSLRQIVRSYDTLLINYALCIGSTFVVCVVIQNDRLDNFLMQSAFAALALMLLQGVAAQRTFGADLLVTLREAQVGMPMVPYFLGKDLASTLEITVAAAVFTAPYGALSQMQLPLYKLYAATWAFIYSLTGLNYIFSLVAGPTAAQMGAVVASFVSFCVAGVYEPPLPVLTSLIGGRGWMIPALSPIRWFWGYLLTAEADYLTDIVRLGAQGTLGYKGYELAYLGQCKSGLFGMPAQKGRISESWKMRDGWVCSVSEMILLGLLFRFIAGVCLVLSVSAENNGMAGKQEGISLSKLLRKIYGLLVSSLIAMFLFAEVWILGATNLQSPLHIKWIQI